MYQTQLFANGGKPIEFVKEGSGTPVVFCHGFPELWYSWRNQIGPVAAAGFEVIVPNMRGYGKSYSPVESSEYAFENITADMVALLDHLGHQQAIFIGHDFGGAIVWAMGQHHPQRVRAIASLNTPFTPYTRLNPLDMLKRRPGKFAYQLYFQEPGIAEKELERDLTQTFNAVFRTSKDKSEKNAMYHTEKVGSGAGFLGMPDGKSDLLSAEEIQIYVEAYQGKGFRPALNWYRNMETNWKASEKFQGKTLDMPCLMITAAEDPVLPPKFADGMEKYIPNLKRHNLEGCGHWSQQEKPEEVTRVLIEWLKSV
ncbi:MAG: alpha/beta hydrolase [Spirochaetes bacterium]|nr:alpha/beta hydrolase [Spirochaetota bacterium]